MRCAACGHRWTAYPEPPLELVSSEEEGALAKVTPDPDAAAPAPLTGEDLPRVFRGRAEEEKRERTLQRERWLAQEAVRRQRTGLADSMRSVLRRTKTDAGHRFPVLAESLAEAFPTASRRLRALSARYGEESQAYRCKVGNDNNTRDELLEKARALSRRV